MTIETIEQVVSLLNEYLVSEITLEKDGARVMVRRSAVTSLPATEFLPVASRTSDEESPITAITDDDLLLLPQPTILTAPMVGLFHHLSVPVRYGGSVAPGQIVGQIESMKLMNDVLAEDGGRVMEVLIEDGAAVEYGQPLFRLTSQDA